jgi:hypothetical protein
MRCASEKTVTSDLFAADHTFEQTRGTAIIEAMKGQHGRQTVAHQTSRYWDRIIVLAELGKSLEIDELGHQALHTGLNIGMISHLNCTAGPE